MFGTRIARVPSVVLTWGEAAPVGRTAKRPRIIRHGARPCAVRTGSPPGPARRDLRVRVGVDRDQCPDDVASCSASYRT
jgi:hypothetical protein